MKKMILGLTVIAVLALVPSAAFADFGVGGAAFYKSPVLIGAVPDPLALNVDQISFGGDVRLKLGWFQAEALLLYSAGQVNSLNMYLDAGVALDIAILRLSLGVGPNLANGFAAGDPVQAGLNAKVGADLVFGPISIGVSYIMSMNLDTGLAVATSTGLLGIQILFWL